MNTRLGLMAPVLAGIMAGLSAGAGDTTYTGSRQAGVTQPPTIRAASVTPPALQRVTVQDAGTPGVTPPAEKRGFGSWFKGLFSKSAPAPASVQRQTPQAPAMNWWRRWGRGQPAKVDHTRVEHGAVTPPSLDRGAAIDPFNPAGRQKPTPRPATPDPRAP